MMNVGELKVVMVVEEFVRVVEWWRKWWLEVGWKVCYVSEKEREKNKMDFCVK
jgi:hypothetical protein